MGLRERLFGRKKDVDDGPDPLADLVLEKLKVGYLVDYDLRTWRVTGYSRYRFAGMSDIEEWELTANGEQRYLERAGDAWSLSQRIAIGDIAGDVRQHILDHDDPPQTIVFQGAAYRLDASCAGHLLPGGDGAGEPVIRWEYMDESETGFVGIEQWGETEFTAAAGSAVEDYQFTHILPGSPT